MIFSRRDVPAGLLSLQVLIGILPFCMGQTPAYDSSVSFLLYCKSNSRPIRLSCREGERRHRSGTIQWRESDFYPQRNCNVTVEVDTGACSATEKFAIYFNIKDLNLDFGDSIDIYENGALIKLLPGGPHASLSFWPTSVGQLRSSFRPKPTIKLMLLMTRRQPSGYGNILTLDYTIVGESRAVVNPVAVPETYCKALGGYMPSEFFCDETNARVNCPSTYPDSLNASDLSPARSTQVALLGDASCDRYTTTTQRHRYTTAGPYRWTTYPSHDGTDGGYQLEWYHIGAIVCAALALFIGVIRAAIYMCCTGPAAETTMHSHPVILVSGPQYPNPNVGAPPPSFVSLQAPGSGSYMGAPPAYTSVFPTGPISESTQDPPKF